MYPLRLMCMTPHLDHYLYVYNPWAPKRRALRRIRLTVESKYVAEIERIKICIYTKRHKLLSWELLSA